MEQMHTTVQKVPMKTPKTDSKILKTSY